jgi:hypothetical protein
MQLLVDEPERCEQCGEFKDPGYIHPMLGKPGWDYMPCTCEEEDDNLRSLQSLQG